MVAVFTVYFEDPFWVGVLESEEDGALTVARHVFGAEPSNAELCDFMLYRFADLRRYLRRAQSKRGPTTDAIGPAASPPKPKRAARAAARDSRRPPSTRAQAAISSALEERKAERRTIFRDLRRAGEERRFELRAEKRKQKRSGH